MPPRLVIVAIVLFWAATTGWLLYREVGPYLGAGEPPAYTIDLTEQVGGSPVSWIMLQQGVRIGTGVTQVTRGPDQTFDLKAAFKFDALDFFNIVFVKKAVGVYRINEEGQLCAVDGEIVLGIGERKNLSAPEAKAIFHADLADGFLTPELHTFLGGEEIELLQLTKAPVSENGSILNPMHPLNRLPGLRAGQHWTIPLFNPLSVLTDQFLGQVPGGLVSKDTALPLLQAAVAIDTLDWNNEEVPCFKIEYHEPGKEVTARTWVRRRDGLVLQQEASQAGKDFVLQRSPEK